MSKGYYFTGIIQTSGHKKRGHFELGEKENLEIRADTWELFTYCYYYFFLLLSSSGVSQYSQSSQSETKKSVVCFVVDLLYAGLVWCL